MARARHRVSTRDYLILRLTSDGLIAWAYVALIIGFLWGITGWWMVGSALAFALSAFLLVTSLGANSLRKYRRIAR